MRVAVIGTGSHPGDIGARIPAGATELLIAGSDEVRRQVAAWADGRGMPRLVLPVGDAAMVLELADAVVRLDELA